MMTPAEWDLWCDAFQAKHGRAPFWDELVLAIQADSRGEPEPAPMTDREIAAASVRNRKPDPAPTAQGALAL